MVTAWRVAVVAVVAAVVVTGCAPGDGEAGARPPVPTTATTRDRPAPGCPVREGEVSDVLGFPVARRPPLVAERCVFGPVDDEAHPGASVELVLLDDRDALAIARDGVAARTGASPAEVTVEGATDAYEVRLGVVAQVGAVDPVGGVVVTVADPARTGGAAAALARELAALALR